MCLTSLNQAWPNHLSSRCVRSEGSDGHESSYYGTGDWGIFPQRGKKTGLLWSSSCSILTLEPIGRHQNGYCTHLLVTGFYGSSPMIVPFFVLSRSRRHRGGLTGGTRGEGLGLSPHLMNYLLPSALLPVRCNCCGP